MQRLEVSGAVRPIYGSLGVKRLSRHNWLLQLRLIYSYLEEAQLKFIAILENMLIIFVDARISILQIKVLCNTTFIGRMFNEMQGKIIYDFVQ